MIRLYICDSYVIQDICSRFEDCMPSPVPLATLTIIGVVLSLIGIVATIVTLLLFKWVLVQYPPKKYHPKLLQLCVPCL